MSSALDKIDYKIVPGLNKDRNLKLYALSTCAFCKKAMTYLQEQGYEFQYIYLDEIDLDLKREAKKELKSTYENIPVFPILTIDDSDAISGFIAPKWAERLGIE